jgi:acetyltransferase-like isoleucine patch superfamily enzyme
LNRGARALMQRIFQYLLLFWRILVLKIRYLFLGIETVNEALLRTTFGTAHILRSFGATIGAGSVIHGPLLIHNAEKDYANLRIGRQVHLGRNVFLDLTDTITLEENTVVSMNCTLLPHQDVGNRPLQAVYPRTVSSLRVFRNAYLGVGVIVLAGSDIGESAVVGAGAVVTNAVPGRQVVAGIPARMIKLVPEDNGGTGTSS